MDIETRQRIFEPFYTTKFTGRGLGMSAVLGIIMSHSGALQLFSQSEEGTTFRVYLPVQDSEPVEDEPAPQSSSALWQGSGTILLVEDEELIKIIASAMIKKLGFSVIEASNGREALDLYQQNAADITLVVTDMGMPVMDGYALFRELKKLKPELPIIISSGFGAVDVTSRISCDDIAGLVGKPYSFDNLREVLKSVVGGAYPTHE
jgi:CheY-like chemotaxis protein